MRIAVEGCAHGCLEEIYSTIQDIEKRHKYKVDLLLCCGDFQSVRNLEDLKTMACPDKYKSAGSFYKYYSASNYLQELPYGGWVAPKIYFLGKASVINVGGIRIGGISGIYKSYNYTSGHHEHLPYSPKTLRSVYHIRNLEVFRLKQLEKSPPDIMLSHDWPCGITDYGNCEQLLRFKPFFKDDIEKKCSRFSSLYGVASLTSTKILQSVYAWSRISGSIRFLSYPLKKLITSKKIFENEFSILEDSFVNSTKNVFEKPDQAAKDLFKTSMPSIPVFNTQTSIICEKLNIFDPVRLSLEKKNMYVGFTDFKDDKCNDGSLNHSVQQSFNEDEIILSDEEETTLFSKNNSDFIKSHNEDEIILSDEEENTSVSKDKSDFVKSHSEDRIIISDKKEENNKTTTDDFDETAEQSFVIDSSPSLNNYENNEEPTIKKRFIKRRNKSIYNSN
ncbi:DBR1 [Lepeophtheirus salmonis]|uniref:DBR1 n=1 Tax=Lepeophtheirus salmonis TaxID=72036 RepID=A0A7R8HAZ2_LEPSM|nr:DBR1 [Lepeophtheirus salmonis]CAF2973611.1 DBR1 [Lepeophtheirus salmonis]